MWKFYSKSRDLLKFSNHRSISNENVYLCTQIKMLNTNCCKVSAIHTFNLYVALHSHIYYQFII